MSTKLTKDDYEREKQLLDSILSANRERRDETYARETADEKSSAERALREKYISDKTAQKRLPQIAAAKGMTGGYIKSAFADSKSGYSSAREEIEAERDSALAKLTEEYLQGGEKDEESYAKSMEVLKRRYASVLKSIYGISSVLKDKI